MLKEAIVMLWFFACTLLCVNFVSTKSIVKEILICNDLWEWFIVGVINRQVAVESRNSFKVQCIFCQLVGSSIPHCSLHKNQKSDIGS